MGKIKNLIEEQKNDLKMLFFNYTFTIIAVALLSIVLCIDFEVDKYKDSIYNIEIFLGLFAVGAVFIETFFVNREQGNNKTRLIIFYIVDIVLSAIWTVLEHFNEEIGNVFDNPHIYYLNISKILGVYIVTLLAVTLYKLVKKSGLKLDTYLARAIFGLLKMWGLFLVLYLAIYMLVAIFDSLIMDIDYWEIMDNIVILIGGFICFPYSLLMITDTKDGNSKFTKGLINFALMPAVIIAILIVYLYIIKIIVNWDIPSNEAFDICLYVFVYGAPVWFLSYGFIREKTEAKGESLGFYGKLVKNIKYGYIPLVILEVVCIAVRIFNYGLTTDRYLAVVAIVFQLVYVLWELIGKALKRELKEEGLILVALGIFVFIMLFPGLNMDRLPAMIQESRFEKALEKEDYATAASAYEYLDYNEYGEAYLAENYTKDTLDTLERTFYYYIYADDEYSYKQEQYVGEYVPYEEQEKGINIAGYTHFYNFNFNSDYENCYTQGDLKFMTISFGEYFEVANVDISGLVDEIIYAYEYSYSYDMEYKYIKVSDNCCIVIEDISFRYNKYTDEITNLHFDGYILTNEGGHNGN